MSTRVAVAVVVVALATGFAGGWWAVGTLRRSAAEGGTAAIAPSSISPAAPPADAARRPDEGRRAVPAVGVATTLPSSPAAAAEPATESRDGSAEAARRDGSYEIAKGAPPERPAPDCSALEAELKSAREKGRTALVSCAEGIAAARADALRSAGRLDCRAELEAALAARPEPAARECPPAPQPRDCRPEVEAALAAPPVLAARECPPVSGPRDCRAEVETALAARTGSRDVVAAECPPPPACPVCSPTNAACDCRPEIEAALAQETPGCPPAAEPRDCRPEVDAALAERTCPPVTPGAEFPPTPAARDCRLEIDSALAGKTCPPVPEASDCRREVAAALNALRPGPVAGARGAAEPTYRELRSRVGGLEGCLRIPGVSTEACLAGKLPFPPGLDVTYGAKQLEQHFRQAFQQTSIKGDVVRVDCDEFPCVVHGRIDADVPITDLLAAPSLQVYEGARRQYSFAKSKVVGADGESITGRTFTIAIYPPTSIEIESLIEARMPLRTAVAGGK